MTMKSLNAAGAKPQTTQNESLQRRASFHLKNIPSTSATCMHVWQTYVVLRRQPIAKTIALKECTTSNMFQRKISFHTGTSSY